MKQFLIKKLFISQPAQQYLTLSIFENNIREKVFIQTNKSWTEVSKYQFILCQNPFIVGIWFNEKSDLLSNNAWIKITDGGLNDLVMICLQKIEIVDLQQGRLILFKLIRSKFLFIPRIHQKLLISYFYLQRKNAVSFFELNSFCATYTYPRKVILTCFGQTNDYNLFPMDLQGYIKEADIYVLGLRNSNVTLKKILNERRVVVCDVASNEKERLVGLGRHHSSQPPSMSDLPFTFDQTAVFKMLIPDIANSYRELEIIHHMNMGSHTVMIGKVVNQNLKAVDLPSLYHLHIASAIIKQNDYSVI